MLLFALVCCYLLLFAVFRFLSLFAYLCCCLLLVAPKSVPGRSQDVHLGTQNDSKMVQKSTKIGSWGSLGTPPGQLNPNFQSQGPILGHFWVPYGVPKSTKNQSLAQKVDPGTMFSSTFVAHCVFYDFQIGFCLIFDQKMTKNNNMFLIVVCFFLNLATFTKHCNLQVRSYVFSFRDFALFHKKRPTNDTKIGYAEIIKK